MRRFRCRAYGRTSDPLTGTPLARLRRRPAWLGHSRALADGLSVCEAAPVLGVHRTTAFRWRHRWLAVPREARDGRFRGIVEADEMFILDSPKGSRARRRRPGRARRVSGSPALVVRDRDGATADAALAGLPEPEVARVPGPLLDPAEVLLRTDGARSFRRLAKRAGTAHRFVVAKAGRRVAGGIFTSRTWTPTTRGWRAGWPAPAASPRDTCPTTWAGAACASAAAPTSALLPSSALPGVNANTER